MALVWPKRRRKPSKKNGRLPDVLEAYPAQPHPSGPDDPAPQPPPADPEWGEEWPSYWQPESAKMAREKLQTRKPDDLDCYPRGPLDKTIPDNISAQVAYELYPTGHFPAVDADPLWNRDVWYRIRLMGWDVLCDYTPGT